MNLDAEHLRLARESQFDQAAIYSDKTLDAYLRVNQADPAGAAVWRETLADNIDREFGRRLTSRRYNGQERRRAQSNAKPNGPDGPQSEPRDDAMPRRLSLSELARREPQPPGFNIPGWLPAGEVTLFAGDGGTGKSAIALMAAICESAGRPFYGIPTERRKVGFVSLEDSEEILHWRLKRATQWLGIDLASLDDWLIAYDASKADGLMLADSRDGPHLTAAYDWLRAEIQAHGLQVIVIDSASDAYGGSENERRAVRMFIRALRRLIPPGGAILLLAHVDKLSARNPDTATGYSGSTAWSNSVRSRWYLRADNDALLLEVQKSNYAPKGSVLRLEWNESAHLFVGTLEMPTSKLDRELADSDEREAVLAALRGCANSAPVVVVPAAMTGPRTAHHVLCMRPEFPKSLRSGKPAIRRFWQQIEHCGQWARLSSQAFAAATAITCGNSSSLQTKRGHAGNE